MIVFCGMGIYVPGARMSSHLICYNSLWVLDIFATLIYDSEVFSGQLEMSKDDREVGKSNDRNTVGGEKYR